MTHILSINPTAAILKLIMMKKGVPFEYMTTVRSPLNGLSLSLASPS
jgi:hypothetical protein